MNFFQNIEYPIIIVSNNDRNDILNAIDYLKLNSDKVITSEDAMAYKPNGKVFELAMEKYNLKPSEIIHIGDSLTNDVFGANKMGITSVWLNRKNKENKTEYKPNIEVNNLNELKEKII